MSELLTELKKGLSSFNMIGTSKIAPDTFKGVIPPKEGKHWSSVRTSIPIEIESGVMIFPRINDGYMTNNPTIRRFGAEKTEDSSMVEIPFKSRLDKDFVKKVANYTLYKTNIEKDENGKPIMKEFIHGIDFEAYLGKHLKDGMEIRISGEVDYSFSKDMETEYRNYIIKSVFLNEGYEKNGEQIDPLPHSATINQTYLVEAGCLDDRWQKDLEGKGATIVKAHVPSYMSKKWDGSNYVEYKKTVAIPQPINIIADITDEKSLARAKVMTKTLFDVPKKKVRQLSLTVKINEGFETGTPDIKVDKELQALIDEGLMDIEDITKQVTVRGERVSELVLVSPRVKINDEGNTVLDIDDNKYAATALIIPEIEVKEAAAEESFETGEEHLDKAPDKGMDDDEFNKLFG